MIRRTLAEETIEVNLCKEKKLTNMRSRAADEQVRLTAAEVDEPGGGDRIRAGGRAHRGDAHGDQAEEGRAQLVHAEEQRAQGGQERGLRYRGERVSGVPFFSQSQRRSFNFTSIRRDSYQYAPAGSPSAEFEPLRSRTCPLTRSASWGWRRCRRRRPHDRRLLYASRPGPKLDSGYSSAARRPRTERTASRRGSRIRRTRSAGRRASTRSRRAREETHRGASADVPHPPRDPPVRSRTPARRVADGPAPRRRRRRLRRRHPPPLIAPPNPWRPPTYAHERPEAARCTPSSSRPRLDDMTNPSRCCSTASRGTPSGRRGTSSGTVTRRREGGVRRARGGAPAEARSSRAGEARRTDDGEGDGDGTAGDGEGDAARRSGAFRGRGCPSMLGVPTGVPTGTPRGVPSRSGRWIRCWRRTPAGDTPKSSRRRRLRLRLADELRPHRAALGGGRRARRGRGGADQDGRGRGRGGRRRSTAPTTPRRRGRDVQAPVGERRGSGRGGCGRDTPNALGAVGLAMRSPGAD